MQQPLHKKSLCGGGVGMIVVVSTIQLFELLICHLNAIILLTLCVNIGVLISFFQTQQNISSQQRRSRSNNSRSRRSLIRLQRLEKAHQKLKVLRVIQLANSCCAFIFLILSLINTSGMANDSILGKHLIVPSSQIGFSESLQTITQMLISPLIFLQVVFQLHLLLLIQKNIKEIFLKLVMSTLEGSFSGDEESQDKYQIRTLSIASEIFKDTSQNQTMITLGLLTDNTEDPAAASIQKPSCPICLVDFIPNESKVIRLPKCDHIFHSSCIRKWALVKLNCPLCREILKSSS